MIRFFPPSTFKKWNISIILNPSNWSKCGVKRYCKCFFSSSPQDDCKSEHFFISLSLSPFPEKNGGFLIPSAAKCESSNEPNSLGEIPWLCVCWCKLRPREVNGIQVEVNLDLDQGYGILESLPWAHYSGLPHTGGDHMSFISGY